MKGNTMNELGRRLIPMPTGALSRPHAGGYTLSAALGWENERYRSVQVTGSTVPA